MHEEINLSRTALCVSQYCTLKCKLCLAFIPYYKNPKNLSCNDAKKVLRTYFEMIDSVNTFTVTGGEPLVNKELKSILELVYTYVQGERGNESEQGQITGTVDFVTNATLDISADVLDLFEEHRNHTRIILSHYGDLSPKIEPIVKELERRNITYRISKFHGDNLYYDGWIDFSDHSEKIVDKKIRDEQGKKCVSRVGRYFVINDAELHSCSRSYWRMSNGIIPKNEQEYIPLMDVSISLEKKRETLRTMLSKDSSTSCGYCVGLLNGVPRQKPAEQL